MDTIHQTHARWAKLVRSVYFWRARSLENDFRTGQLPTELTEALIRSVETSARHVAFTASEGLEGYVRSQLPEDVVALVQANYDFFEIPDDKVLRSALKFVGKFAAREFGHPVKVVNLRLWNLTQSSAADAAANAWHRDGLPPLIMKLMIYLTAPSVETGTTQVKRPDESVVTLEGPRGSFILFDNNGLLHRGIPPARPTKRTVLEITFMPALISDFSPVYAGVNAQFPAKASRLMPGL